MCFIKDFQSTLQRSDHFRVVAENDTIDLILYGKDDQCIRMNQDHIDLAFRYGLQKGIVFCRRVRFFLIKIYSEMLPGFIRVI